MSLRSQRPSSPSAGRAKLRPLNELSGAEWARFHRYFRDREIAEWNGSQPIRMPLWLFKRVVLGEERSGERCGFGIFTENDEFIGSVELYDITPTRPRQAVEATLGIIIGEKDRWGHGYGTDAVRAVLQYAFGTLGLERVRLSTFEHNTRARRAFEKAGFHLERIVNSRGQARGPRRDALYVIDRRDWSNRDA